MFSHVLFIKLMNLQYYQNCCQIEAMKIKRAKIQNFRCIEEVDIDFDEVTTFIGPNGAGKSSVLRALDWFFNGDKSAILADDDVFFGAKSDNKKISVEVEFNDLSPTDREELGSYVPAEADTFLLWRSWEGGRDKITGKALAYAPFDVVRQITGARDKKTAYDALRNEHPELNLPVASSAPAVEAAMITWERSNVSELTETEVDVNNFYGWHGQEKLASLFDFVFVTADLRAEEEAADTKSAILGKILERALDRTSADQELIALASEIKEKQNEIYNRNFGMQLNTISDKLSDAVGAFTVGRKIKVAAQEVDSKPSKAQFQVSIMDNLIETKICKQGHGFQRALIISALKLLAEQSITSERTKTICLAIEEPELFQHPTQALAFASVLRKLAEDTTQNTQVTYATHSPYFIEATHFDQIRRLHRIQNGSTPPKVIVRDASIQKVINKLAGHGVDELTIRRQINGVCLGTLPVALFAEKVVLTEGTTDCAVIEGVAERNATSPLAVDGIAVVSVGSKTSMLLPCAILDLLEIKKYIVFDADSGYETRARASGKKEADIVNEIANSTRHNKAITNYLGINPPVEWPTTIANDNYATFSDSLELSLADWNGWQDEKEKLLVQGDGFDGKDAATYKKVSTLCSSNPPTIFTDIIEKVKSL